MNRNLLGRGLVILASIVVAVILAYPPKDKINLGLDLQGGMHLVLQVHTEDAVRAEVDSDVDRLLAAAKDKNWAGLTARRVGDASFEVAGTTEADRDAVSKYLADSFRDYALVRGASLRYEMKADVVGRNRELAVKQAVETIRNRIDAFGVAETVVQEASNNRVVVELPGVDDPDRVRRLIKSTAFLEFRLVSYPQGGGGSATREEILQHYNNQLPADVEIMEGDRIDRETRQVVGKEYYAVDKRRVITGRDLKNARPSQGQFSQPVVQFTLTPSGAQAFGAATGANVGRGLGIVLDGRVVSAPRINSKITDSGIIEGNFTQQEVDDLSTVLRSGALPASLTYLEERTVGPALGRDSIRQGMRAAIVGPALVIVAMLLIYNLTGVNAVMALILNVLLLFGGMGAFHSTLTLPGIAGVILTIGMAVDANVLVFERIREELRAGRTVRSAIDLGFQHAFTSIIDTHVTTIVSAMILFQFGTGPIKGFAVTLTIGLLASLFTAVFVSRWIFDLVLSRRRVQRLSI